MSVRKSGKIIAGTPRTTGGVEIGDIGFAPLGIDESLNLRRYLNGQVISQTQFVSFTNKVKAAVALHPSLSTTETNWQAEKANSKLGQCGKFVVDDTAGTIRLPCVVNAQGLTDLQYLGTIKNESLPNIKGSWAGVYNSIGMSGAVDGLFSSTDTTLPESISVGGQSVYAKFDINASRSSSTYQDNAPVQQEAVQYPYYIQVATGIEETLPAIREYQVNNSDYFGKSMYSDVAPDNASWLVSNGQWNAKSVYPDYYNWFVDKLNAGKNQFKQPVGYAYSDTGSTGYFWWIPTTNPVVGMIVYAYDPGKHFYVGGQIESVNENTFTFTFNDGSTQVQYTVVRDSTKDTNNYVGGSYWITDYDFVINQNDQTFRLPLLNGEEDLPGNTSIDLAIQDSGSTYTASANGTVFFVSVSTGTNQFVALQNNTAGLSSKSLYSSGSNQSFKVLLDVKRGDVFMVAYQTSPEYLRFIPSVGNGTLYYYVGDTVQDASLINAGAVLGQLSNKADIDASNFNADGKSLLSGLGMPSGRYIDLTLGASNSTYTAPANGYFSIYVHKGNSTTGYVRFHNGSVVAQDARGFGSTGDGPLYAYIPALKGQSVICSYVYNGTFQYFRFIYAEGENNV